MRKLIDEDLIPDDVTIQVLTQSREELIRRTFEALARREARDHAPVQLDVDRAAARGVRARTRPASSRSRSNGADADPRRARPSSADSEWTLRVLAGELHRHRARLRARDLRRGDGRLAADAGAQADHLNLPATVELVDAQRLRRPDRVDAPQPRAPRQRSSVELHPHNDRGMRRRGGRAGASWPAPSAIEGCLFGNGERTGNVCLVTLGAEPVTRRASIRARLLRHQRDHPHRRVLQPAAGASAPSVRRRARVHRVLGLAPGRDQEGARRADAQWLEAAGRTQWDVPYLPIDPADVGRTYDAVIRVNSQSGKGGIAYLLERDYGLALPRLLQIEFSQVIQQITDATGKELPSSEIHAAFEREYLRARLRRSRYRRPSRAAQRRRRPRRASDRAHRRSTASSDAVRATATDRSTHSSTRCATRLGLDIHVQNYHEHGVGSGEDATAVVVRAAAGRRRSELLWRRTRQNIVTATLRAVVSATNRAVERGWVRLPHARQVANA